ncbi:MAG: putative 2OG-Fe(II) oxygenase [Gammaproteobacteria bacterium]|nr:putative 2OG-Fe(II) oxygenase [Gammaproteobacteria bacterium]
MKHQTIPLFALPVTRIDVDCDGIAEFFDSVVKPSKGRSNTDGTTGYATPLIHYHNDQNVFDIYDELKDFGDRILEASNFVYRNVMNHDTELRITNAWFNECDVGGRQYMHNHCNSAISGTIYLRTDQHSYLQFHSPYGMNDFGNLLLDEPNTKRPNQFGYSHHFKIVTYKVEDGACLFWPSHLRHGYTENLTPQRLSLSFNFLPTTFNCVYKS